MAVALSVAAGAALGTGAPAPSVQADSRDDSLIVMFGTGGSGTAAGVVGTITLGGNYSQDVTGATPPNVDVPILKAVWAALSAAAQACGLYIDAPSCTTRTIVFKCANAPATGLPANSGGIVIAVRIDL